MFACLLPDYSLCATRVLKGSKASSSICICLVKLKLPCLLPMLVIQNENALCMIGQTIHGNGVCLSLFSWQPLSTAFSKVFSLSEDVNFRTDTFSMMHKLRLLLLNYVQLGGSYKRFPRKLRLLCWHGFHLKSIPSDFPLESLVSLDFRHSNLEQLWKGTKVWLLIFPCLHLCFIFFM